MAHDHSRNSNIRARRALPRSNQDDDEFSGRGGVKRRAIKEEHKQKLIEAKYLLTHGNVPLKNVAKRLSMTLYQVRRIKSDDINDPEEAFKR